MTGHVKISSSLSVRYVFRFPVAIEEEKHADMLISTSAIVVCGRRKKTKQNKKKPLIFVKIIS